MGSKYKIFFIILSLLAQFCFFPYVQAEPARISDRASEEMFLPVSIPEKDRLTLVSSFGLIVEGEIVGQVAVYDDATTERPADYLELYNRTGGLLALSWFDRFGIERLAVDRGLLKEADQLEGVFVLLLEEDFI